MSSGGTPWHINRNTQNRNPRRNTALKLLPLVLAAIVAVVLIVRSVGKGKPDDAPTTPPTTEETPPLEPVASATVGVQATC